ncbi:hypothetical protein LCGC14_1777250 [marine sediment metagenome]|uniref:Uncharacterized protein n=1 Tax=marine sediment metagenome TaxID=412755 RepID=A0A0F9JW46_9ZZZZ
MSSWSPLLPSLEAILIESDAFLLQESGNLLFLESSDFVSWSASTTSTICWAQLSTDTREGDVDFILSASSQFPMCVSSNTDRALSAYSSIISNP